MSDMERERRELQAEVERLRRWKAEATEVILGLQDLGKTLGLRLGARITGASATEAAKRLSARAEAAEAALADRWSLEGNAAATAWKATWEAVNRRREEAEAKVARVEELLHELEVESVHGFSDQRAEAREFLRRLRPALKGADDA